jgi:hypothetical protein
MILKEKLDAKTEMALNGKNYWGHYRKLPLNSPTSGYQRVWVIKYFI